MPIPAKDEGNGGQTREEAYMLYLFPPDVKGDSILGDRVPLDGVAEALDAWPEATAIVRRQYRRLREAGVPLNVARSTVVNLLQLGVTAEATRVTRRWFAAQVSDPAEERWAITDAGREALMATDGSACHRASCARPASLYWYDALSGDTFWGCEEHAPEDAEVYRPAAVA